MRTLAILAGLFVLGLFAGSFVAAADSPQAEKPDKKAKPKRVVEVTVEQEQEVLQFLRQHHPELSELLLHLKSARPSEYQRAVRDLVHTRERLRQIEERDRDHYDGEVRAWVLQSKIQLLVARLAMSDSAALRDELRQLLGEQADVKLRLLVAERDQHAERLRKLEEQINRLSAGRQETIDKQFANLTKSCENLKAKRKGLKDAPPKAASQPATGSPSPAQPR